MSKRIELIPKQSTLDDMIGPWVNSGREDNCKGGQFVFNAYSYSMADFYRVKGAG